MTLPAPRRLSFFSGSLGERLDVDHHDLHHVAGGEAVNGGEAGGIVDEVLEVDIVERFEVTPHGLDAVQHTLADGDAGHNDDELFHAVTLVEFEHRLGVGVRAIAHCNVRCNTGGTYSKLRHRYQRRTRL